MVQNIFSPFSYLHYSSWNTLMLGKPCQPHYDPHQSCPQVWHGSSYDYMTTLPHLVACQTYHQYSSLHHQNPPRHTKMHVQSIPHLHNNKLVQHAYNVELQNFSTLPTHPISIAPLHETDIRSGKALNLESAEFMEEVHDMTTKGNQECQSYIEYWFHSIICLHHHSTLRQFLAPSFQKKIVSHTLVFINMHFYNLGMYILEALFLKWLHWKYSYT